MRIGSVDGHVDTPAGAWIERRTALDRREFRARYLRARRPVVISGAAQDWPAMGRFTPEWFRRQHGDAPVRVRGRQARLGDIIDQQLASTEAEPAPYPCTLVDPGAVFAQMTAPHRGSIDSSPTTFAPVPLNTG